MKEKNSILSLNHRIFATFDNSIIRVYQAYNDVIADDAIKNNKFGEGFSFERMTWIKPSFLWMMYRSGWGTKEGQNRILAIDLKRECFDFFVKNAVLSSYSEILYSTNDEWRKLLNEFEIRCQWDPERNIYGQPLDSRSIQIGISKKMSCFYNDNIIKITDLTEKAADIFNAIKNNLFCENMLPEIKEYFIN